jgi:dihydrofolate reductase
MDMRLVATEYLSLDGIFEEPGRWPGPFFDQKAAQFKFNELQASDALLLGRKTYEGFAAAWPSITDEAGFADKMNSMPKYVVSATLAKAEWPGSTLIRATRWTRCVS